MCSIILERIFPFESPVFLGVTAGFRILARLFVGQMSISHGLTESIDISVDAFGVIMLSIT